MKSNYELFGREHRKGWNKLVDNLISDLNNIDQKWEMTQCKEKFGGLRFYTHNTNEEQQKMIEKAEEDSYTICEVCGEPGELRDELPWIQTLCWKHYAKELEDKLLYMKKFYEEEE